MAVRRSSTVELYHGDTRAACCRRCLLLARDGSLLRRAFAASDCHSSCWRRCPPLRPSRQRPYAARCSPPARGVAEAGRHRDAHSEQPHLDNGRSGPPRRDRAVEHALRSRRDALGCLCGGRVLQAWQLDRAVRLGGQGPPGGPRRRGAPAPARMRRRQATSRPVGPLCAPTSNPPSPPPSPPPSYRAAPWHACNAPARLARYGCVHAPEGVTSLSVPSTLHSSH